MIRFLRHARGLWPRFFLAPVIPYWLWVAFWRHGRALRWDHVAMAMAATGLAYGNERTKRLLLGVIPLSLVAMLYDGMRLVKAAGFGPSNVHVCDFRELELRWFGIGQGAGRMTLPDWFQEHATRALDLYCAIPYGVFLYVVMGYAVYLLAREAGAQRRFAWGFLFLNIAGFVTYHLYPVAPPWYFHKYGCAVDLAAPPSQGPNLTRVDAILGFPYFAGFYARSSDVFGALPSLHVAYPLLMLVEGWRLHGRVGRTLLVLFYASMCLAAPYLDHHWVVDIVLGSSYALGVALLVRRIWPVSAAAPVTAQPYGATD